MPRIENDLAYQTGSLFSLHPSKERNVRACHRHIGPCFILFTQTLTIEEEKWAEFETLEGRLSFPDSPISKTFWLKVENPDNFKVLSRREKFKEEGFRTI